MVSTINSSQKDRICSMPNFNSILILGSTNFQASALKNNDAIRCHNQAVCEKEPEKVVAAGRSFPPRKVVQHALSISTISQGTQLMCDLDHDTVKKLHKITDWIALKGQPFSNFKEQLEREQMHGVKYSRAYEKDKMCKNFYFWYC